MPDAVLQHIGGLQTFEDEDDDEYEDDTNTITELIPTGAAETCIKLSFDGIVLVFP